MEKDVDEDVVENVEEHVEDDVEVHVEADVRRTWRRTWRRMWRRMRLHMEEDRGGHAEAERKRDESSSRNNPVIAVTNANNPLTRNNPVITSEKGGEATGHEGVTGHPGANPIQAGPGDEFLIDVTAVSGSWDYGYSILAV